MGKQSLPSGRTVNSGEESVPKTAKPGPMVVESVILESQKPPGGKKSKS